MSVRAPEQDRALRSMRDAVDHELAVAATGGARASFGVDATRVARGPGGCLYRVDPPPEASLIEDAPARLSIGNRHADGWLGPVADESCLVEADQDLGPRVLDGRLVADNTGPMRGLRARLVALEGTPTPPTFRFDQARLVLGAPGGRIRDAISTAAETTEEWRYDDRTGDVLRSALSHRWASLQSPPGTDIGGLLARLLDRLLSLDAKVLFTAPSGHAVDRTVGALCERLARADRLRSGAVQRIGALAPGAVRDRFGPFVEASTIAADLRSGVESRLGDLDRLEHRLQLDELDRRAAELERDAEAVEGQLERTVGARVNRRGRGIDPDTLVIRRHQLRTQGRNARQDADRIAQELSASGRPVPTAADVLGPGGTPAEQRGRLVAARKELRAAAEQIEATLRVKARLVAATTRGAYLRGLPRADFDVVVLTGPTIPPEAYYLAGLSTRSVIAIGDAGPDRPPPPSGRDAPPELPRRRRPFGRSAAD